MTSFNHQLTPLQHQRLCALDAWHRALDDGTLRRHCPDAYNEELLRQADEVDRIGLVDWPEWRELRVRADQAYLRAVAGEDYHPARPCIPNLA